MINLACQEIQPPWRWSFLLYQVPITQYMITNVIKEKIHWWIGQILIKVSNWLNNPEGFAFTCEVVSVFFTNKKTEAMLNLLNFSQPLNSILLDFKIRFQSNLQLRIISFQKPCWFWLNVKLILILDFFKLYLSIVTANIQILNLYLNYNFIFLRKSDLTTEKHLLENEFNHRIRL